MRRLMVALLVLSLIPCQADGKGGGGGGRSSSGGRSYSSGRSSSSSGRSSYSSGRSSSSGGRSSYSSGSKSSTPKYSSGSRSSTPKSSTPKYSAGSKSSSSKTKPASTSFDSFGTRAQRRVEGSKAVKATSQPKSNYSTPTGSYSSAKPKSYSKSTASRTTPGSTTVYHRHYYPPNYNNYTSSHPMWNDYSRHSGVFDTVFLLWMVNSLSANQRADWIYHHRNEMDDQLYGKLVADNSQIKARLQELEAQKTVRDTKYEPPGIDARAQYTATAAQVQQDAAEKAAAEAEVEKSSGGSWFAAIVIIAIILGAIWYGVFVYKW